MRIGEFHHPVMRWSMYNSSPVDRLYDDWQERGMEMDGNVAFAMAFSRAYDAQELELDAPHGMEDGIYDFRVEKRTVVFNGIVVKDGKFDPLLTAHAIYMAQYEFFGSSRFDHVYIEAIRWDGFRFEVTIGS